MTRKTIGALPATTSLPDSALVEVESGGASKKITLAALRNSLIPGGIPDLGGVEGNIDDLSTQIQQFLDLYGTTITAADAAAAAELARVAAVYAKGLAEQLAGSALLARDAAIAAAQGAITQIEWLGNDGVLSRAEKIGVLIPRSEELETLWTALESRVDGLSYIIAVSLAFAAAEQAREDWIEYRDDLNPAWNDVTQHTPVDRTTFKALLSAYSAALAELSLEISDYANFPDNLSPHNKSKLHERVLALQVYYEQLADDVTATVSDIADSRYLAFEAATNAKIMLMNFLAAIVPPWDDLTKASPVDGDDLNALLGTLEQALSSLDSALKLGAPPGTNVGGTPAEEVSDATVVAGKTADQLVAGGALTWRAQQKVGQEVSALGVRVEALANRAATYGIDIAGVRAAYDALVSLLTTASATFGQPDNPPVTLDNGDWLELKAAVEAAIVAMGARLDATTVGLEPRTMSDWEFVGVTLAGASGSGIGWGRTKSSYLSPELSATLLKGDIYLGVRRSTDTMTADPANIDFGLRLRASDNKLRILTEGGDTAWPSGEAWPVGTSVKIKVYDFGQRVELRIDVPGAGETSVGLTGAPVGTQWVPVIILEDADSAFADLSLLARDPIPYTAVKGGPPANATHGANTVAPGGVGVGTGSQVLPATDGLPLPYMYRMSGYSDVMYFDATDGDLSRRVAIPQTDYVYMEVESITRSGTTGDVEVRYIQYSAAGDPVYIVGEAQHLTIPTGPIGEKVKTSIVMARHPDAVTVWRTIAPNLGLSVIDIGLPWIEGRAYRAIDNAPVIEAVTRPENLFANGQFKLAAGTPAKPLGVMTFVADTLAEAVADDFTADDSYFRFTVSYPEPAGLTVDNEGGPEPDLEKTVLALFRATAAGAYRRLFYSLSGEIAKRYPGAVLRTALYEYRGTAGGPLPGGAEFVGPIAVAGRAVAANRRTWLGDLDPDPVDGTGALIGDSAVTHASLGLFVYGISRMDLAELFAGHVWRDGVTEPSIVDLTKRDYAATPRQYLDQYGTPNWEGADGEKNISAFAGLTSAAETFQLETRPAQIVPGTMVDAYSGAECNLVNPNLDWSVIEARIVQIARTAEGPWERIGTLPANTWGAWTKGITTANPAVIGDTSSSGVKFDGGLAITTAMVATGNTIAAASTQLLPNYSFDIPDSVNKPAGIMPVEGTAVRDFIEFEAGQPGNAVIKQRGTGAYIAYGFPAIAIDDTLIYTTTITHRSSAAGAGDTIWRWQETNAPLPAGKTHIGYWSAGDHAVVRTSYQEGAGGAMPGTSATTVSYDYVPTPGTKFASFSMYNYLGDVDLIVEQVTVTTRPNLLLAESRTNAAAGSKLGGIEPGANVTGDHISAGIAGQGALATQDAASWSGGQVVDRPPLSGGGSLVDDPNMGDATAWTIYTGAGQFGVAVADGGVARTCARVTTGTLLWFSSARRVPVDPTKTYRIRSWARRSADANGSYYACVDMRDASGGMISVHGTMTFYLPANVTPGTTWTAYEHIFGAGTGNPIPSNAVEIGVGAILNYDGTAGYMEVQGLILDEVAAINRSLYKADGTLATTADVYTPAGVAGGLAGAGSGAYANTLTQLNAGEGTKLNGIETGATVGGTVGTNIKNGGGTTLAVDQILNNRIEGNVLRIPQPVGGSYNGIVSETGAIKIKLPVSWQDSMFTFDVRIYNYATGQTAVYTIGGYLYSSGTTWYNEAASMVGPDGMRRTVRFGHDGSKCCVWIGEPATVWAYPQVQVENVVVGYVNNTEAAWRAGWSVTVDSNAATNVTRTVAYPNSGEAVMGKNILESSGGSTATRADYRTDQGPAAALIGAGSGAYASNLWQLNHDEGNRLGWAIDSAGFLKSGIAGADGAPVVSTVEMLSQIRGRNISTDPEFANWAAGSGVYDNSGSGKTTTTPVTDTSAPNSSGKVLKISYDGTGTEHSAPQPGWGGYINFLQCAPDTVSSRPGYYAVGTTLYAIVRAKVPAGRYLQQASNSLGDGSAIEWLTSNAGTGAWEWYVLRYKIGATNSAIGWSSTGHMYVYGGPNTAFDWYVARHDFIDVSSADATYSGRSLLSGVSGAALTDSTIVTNIGTAGALAGAGTGAYANDLGDLDAAADTKLGGVETGADVTAKNLPFGYDLPALYALQGDVSQMFIYNPRQAGGLNVSASSTWAHALTGGLTGEQNTTAGSVVKGSLRITAMTCAAGYALVSSTYAGVPIAQVQYIERYWQRKPGGAPNETIIGVGNFGHYKRTILTDTSWAPITDVWQISVLGSPTWDWGGQGTYGFGFLFSFMSSLVASSDNSVNVEIKVQKSADGVTGWTDVPIDGVDARMYSGSGTVSGAAANYSDGTSRVISTGNVGGRFQVKGSALGGAGYRVRIVARLSAVGSVEAYGAVMNAAGDSYIEVP